jgi:hypothetical protein
VEGLGYSSMIESMLSLYKALGSILRTRKKRGRKEGRKKRQLTTTITSCVTTGKLLNFSLPISSKKMGTNNNGTYLIRLL